MIKQRRQIPAVDLHDPNYKRLRYCRYADDFILGLVGTFQDAQAIKQKVGQFLQDNLKLELSDHKTLITASSQQPARFLGYQIQNQQANDKCTTSKRNVKKRSINGVISLRVPVEVITKKCTLYTRAGKAIHRPELQDDSDYSIVTRYQQEYRGVVQYYALAQNVCHLSKLHWVMQSSLLKTLAGKHKTTSSKILAKYQTTCQTLEGKTVKCLEVRVQREQEQRPALIARFGGISLKRQTDVILDETPYVYKNRRTEILKRLLANECELCGATQNIEVHHIRKLSNLKEKGVRDKPQWVKEMVAKRRKTLMVCRKCHDNIHAGKPTRIKTEMNG
ncbi:MAG TPA: group II intron reverse transcriptase/maturase [Chloroflexia bacterium]|nr:group II intron reverse transcriptase/maturase [Chloroflexia bacterium]